MEVSVGRDQKTRKELMRWWGKGFKRRGGEQDTFGMKTKGEILGRGIRADARGREIQEAGRRVF